MKSVALALFVATFASMGTARAEGALDQQGLEKWWAASADMWIGNDAYEAKGTTYTDGQCTAQFDEGIIIPVYTGRPPLSERVVGVLFVGKGGLSVDLPNRADAWSLSNHMVMSDERTREEMAPVASGEAPFTTGIERAVILSADPAVEQMLLNKMPVGSGVYRTTTEDGVNEEYVVTENRGKIRAKMISTNMLPQRALMLERAGMDPVAMLRQDRLMHEGLSFPTGQLRRIADFRTTDRFHVASGFGAGVGPTGFDSWMTCFNDPLGQSDVGEQSIVFSHGEDVNGVRHLQRLAGKPYDLDKGEKVSRPKVMMEAVLADSVVTMKPVQRRNYMSVVVESLLTVRARGGDLQHVALALPTEGSPLKEFKLLGVEAADGSQLSFVGLHADDAFSVQKSQQSTADAMETTIDEGAQTMEGVSTPEPALAGAGAGAGDRSTELVSGEGGQGGASGAPDGEDVASPLDMETVSPTTRDFELISETPFNFEIFVLLPEVVPDGETAQIRVKWRTQWKNNQRSWGGLPLGATTGVKRFLPDLLPSPGGTVWHAKTEVNLAPSRFFPLEAVVTGTTLSEEILDDGWRKIISEESHARYASVGSGKWVKSGDPATEGLPGVQVAINSIDRAALAEFPPEIRRVVSFLQRFLPKLEADELEVYHGPAMLPETALSSGFRWGRSGLIQLRDIKTPGVGANTEIKNQYPGLTQYMLARQVAAQYWGQRTPPNSSRDMWVTTALADAYAAFYLRAALGKDTWKKRMGQVRKRLQRDRRERETQKLRRPLSLSEPSKLSDISMKLRSDYGFYVIARSLKDRVGQPAFFLGIDRLAQRRNHIPVTTEDLLAVFEETSGEDLSDFFDFWIHGGRIPKLALKYALVATEEGTHDLHGCIESDVPFGSFDVPVVLEDGTEELAALVDVDDGYGFFKVPGRSTDVDTQLDPTNQLVFYDRSVKKVGSVEDLACPAD